MYGYNGPMGSYGGPGGEDDLAEQFGGVGFSDPSRDFGGEDGRWMADGMMPAPPMGLGQGRGYGGRGGRGGFRDGGGNGSYGDGYGG